MAPRRRRTQGAAGRDWSEDRWMIYGAYGYTGRRVVKEALRRGHKPVLAGRSPDKLHPLAERLELEAIVLDLQDADELSSAAADVNLVFHAAGPFIHTSAPMARACLKAGAHYLDIAGEVRVFEALLALDRQARERSIAVLPGVGFNVLATDCLARHAIQRVENPAQLEIATCWISDRLSGGSFKTMIDGFPVGALIRRDGKLERTSVREGRRRVRFIDREREVVPASLGDLSTAYAANGIPNISTFTALPDGTSGVYAWAEPIYRRLFSSPALRRIAKSLAGRTMRGSDELERKLEPSQAWVRVSNADGEEAQAWLETPESYRFTAAAGVRAVEKVLADRPQGAMTPAQAFGADFVLEIPETRRVDRLEAV